MEKNILLILGHPSEKSFCNALLSAYKAGAEGAGAVCKVLYLCRLSFDPDLHDGYRSSQAMELEDDLLTAQELLLWADHVVLVYPNWWGFMPAIAKGFIDRVLLPGFAFRHHKGQVFPEPLLTGRSMRLLVTMDTPKWWFYLVYHAAQYQILRHIVFGYVGIKPMRCTTFGLIRRSKEKLRAQWLHKAEQLGRQCK